MAELTRLQSGVVLLASKHADTIIPGFTHLLVAQPVTFGHHLYVNETLERDHGRLIDCRRRLNVRPWVLQRSRERPSPLIETLLPR